MAKYKRFDPSNKKARKDKYQSKNAGVPKAPRKPHKIREDWYSSYEL